MISFDPQCIMVSYSSIHEYNRLRSEFKTDLPQYDVPSGSNSKVKLTGRNDVNLDSDSEPTAKKTKLQKSANVVVDAELANKTSKRKLPPDAENDPKKLKTDTKASVTPNNNASSSRCSRNNLYMVSC